MSLGVRWGYSSPSNVFFLDLMEEVTEKPTLGLFLLD